MRRAVVPLLAAGSVALVALPAGAATSVNVTAGKPQELRFTLSKKRVKAGKVTFRITNRGSLKHDFRIAGKTTKLIPKGKSVSLTVTLRKGRNRYVCTVPGHAEGGMRGVVTAR